MIKIKHLALITIASSTLLFSGLVHVEDTFPDRNRHCNDIALANNSLVTYSYPYYYDRPFYYLSGRYYYGGFFRNGFYHYGNRKFKRGHYYSRGYRYYNGRRYRAENGRYGYFENRIHFERKYHYGNKASFTRGRQYKKKHITRRKRTSHLQPRYRDMRKRDRN